MNDMIILRPYRPLLVKKGAVGNILDLVGVAQCIAMTIIRAIAVVVLVIMPATPLFAMGAKQPVEKGKDAAPPSQPASSGRGVTVRAIQENPALFTQKEIVLEGVFRGWTGTCRASSMLTRSDWVLEDESGCIYITGRIPNTLSPAQPKGERVLVRGLVITTDKGTPVINASGIALLPK